MHNKLHLHIPEMDCAAEAQDIERALKNGLGILHIESIYLNHQTTVTYDPALTDELVIISQIKSKTGFSVSKAEGAQQEPDAQKRYPYRPILLLSGVLLVTGLALSIFSNVKAYATWLELASLLIVLAPILQKAFVRIKANPFNTNVLMSTAGVGSLLIGSYAEGAAVLLLYVLAELLESYTTDRVRNTTKKIAKLLPKRALLKADQSLIEVPVEELKVGDLIVVKPGWRIPVDGRIVSGSSSIDQASVTGESVPVEKTTSDSVLSGTLNLDSSLEIAVTKVFADSTTSRIIDLVMNAQSRKANAEKFVDKFSRYYTPAMLVLALLVALVPPLFLQGAWSEWAYRALIVIVIACPSAFLISTPITVLISLTAAMRSGVLIKGGLYIETLSQIKAVIFDKTGTLTEGRPAVIGIDTCNGFQEVPLLEAASALEASSSHPLALAIVSYAEMRKVSIKAAEVTEASGKGVRGTVGGQEVLAGKLAYLQENNVDVSPALRKATEATQVGIAIGGKLAGVISLSDALRAEASQTVAELQQIGIAPVAMLTGDRKSVAKTIANQLGITEVYADLLPEDKERIAKDLRQKYGTTAMVGDGINDAPVLAASNVGIALSSAGNDIAIEAADVALMSGNLRAIPYLIKHGRKSVAKLRANLALALALKLAMIVGGVLGIIPLWAAVLGDDGATLIVIANSLPLLRHTLQTD